MSVPRSCGSSYPWHAKSTKNDSSTTWSGVASGYESSTSINGLTYLATSAFIQFSMAQRASVESRGPDTGFGGVGESDWERC